MKPQIILAVDDDMSARNLYRRIFTEKPEDFAVLLASSGKEALEFLSKKTCDCMVLDLYMPEMSGFEVLEQVRSKPELKNLPIAVVTGSEADEDGRRALMLGADDYIEKPFKIMTFLTKIKNLLERAGNLKSICRIQSELASARERYSRLYDSASAGYFTVSEKGLIMEANLTAAKLFGVKRESLVKQPVTRFIYPENQDIFCEAHKRLVETGAPQTSILRMLRADAPSFWGRVDMTLEQGADDLPVCRAIMNDITEFKLANEVLLKYDEQFKQIFALSPDGIFISALDGGKIIEVNDAMLVIFGYNYKKTIGSTALELNIWAKPNERDLLVKKLLKGNVIQNAEVVLRRISGELFYAAISVGFIVFKEKKCLIITVRDIDKQKKTAEALKKAYSELKAKENLLEHKDIAFREVVNAIEFEKKALKDEVVINVNEIILPILKRFRLKSGTLSKYVDLLEKSLMTLVSSFGRRLIEKNIKLTPKEIEVCNMIKSGLTTKEIAGLLDASPMTIDKHRNNIRKKLGLAKKDINLTSFLQSL